MMLLLLIFSAERLERDDREAARSGITVASARHCGTPAGVVGSVGVGARAAVYNIEELRRARLFWARIGHAL